MLAAYCTGCGAEVSPSNLDAESSQCTPSFRNSQPAGNEVIALFEQLRSGAVKPNEFVARFNAFLYDSEQRVSTVPGSRIGELFEAKTHGIGVVCMGFSLLEESAFAEAFKAMSAASVDSLVDEMERMAFYFETDGIPLVAQKQPKWFVSGTTKAKWKNLAKELTKLKRNLTNLYARFAWVAGKDLGRRVVEESAPRQHLNQLYEAFSQRSASWSDTASIEIFYGVSAMSESLVWRSVPPYPSSELEQWHTNTYDEDALGTLAVWLAHNPLQTSEQLVAHDATGLAQLYAVVDLLVTDAQRLLALWLTLSSNANPIEPTQMYSELATFSQGLSNLLETIQTYASPGT